jgi:hypothetical protein
MSDLSDPKFTDPVRVILGDAYGTIATPVGDVEATAPGWTLTRRQEHLYRWRADLYAPLVPDVDNEQAPADEGWPLAPTYQSVPCWRSPAQEQDAPTPAGRAATGLDVFRFPVGVSLSDGWLIKLFPLEAEELVGATGNATGQMQGEGLQESEGASRFYLVQSAPEAHPMVGRRTVNHIKALAKHIAPPKTYRGQLFAT